MKYWVWIVWVLCAIPCWAADLAARAYPSSIGALKIEVVAEGLEHPWSLAFLPDGSMLVTERPGRLRIIEKNGTLGPPILGVPKVFAEGQGGLLDVITDPDFKSNRIIYFSYAEEESGKAGTAVARALLKNNRLEKLEVIFRQQPKVTGPNHWGSRLVLAPDEKLFITLGERYKYPEKAQDLSSHLGKVVRIETDGSLITGNPFTQSSETRPEIWSYGHRNIQGATSHPKTGELWTHEHGPRGGDEINITTAGKNYGWPQASYGMHYTYLPIPNEHTKHGFMEPVYYWDPSIAPSGMMFYTGKQFSAWRGDLFVGALAGQCLIRLDVQNEKVLAEERLLTELGERIRDVRQGPDGYIYLLTDSEDGKILRLMPVE